MRIIFKFETKTTGFRDPDIHMLKSERFNRLWKALKDYDIGKPVVETLSVDGRAVHRDSKHLYSGTTGTDIRFILDTLYPQKKL